MERRVEVTVEILLASTILGPPNASVEKRVAITSNADARTKLSVLSMSTVNREPRLVPNVVQHYECATIDILEDKRFG